jgi:D-lactate dehydrogenase (cytochrome)
VGKFACSPLNKTWIKDLKPIQLLDAPMPSLPKDTLRDSLPACGPNQVLVMEPPGEARNTVFYFPGCGSERLHSVISKAGIYILLKAGVRVVLPPPFLCCSFPAKVNAETLQRDHLNLRNTILFNQTREMLRYLTFDACVVTCGTCKEALEELGTAHIFDCPVMDASGFIMEKGLEIPSVAEEKLYHAPCHDSLEGNALRLFREATGEALKNTAHCCSEAGTMSLSRTDITNRMRIRKHATLKRATEGMDKGASPVLLTNCPSCIQGLGRNMDLGVTPRHLTEEIALRIGGTQWEKELKRLLANTDAVNI